MEGDKTRQPDPRWAEYIEVYDQQNRPIGFNLPNNTFLFKYDVDGGWEDEQGRYYNAEGILQSDDQHSDDEDDELSDHEDEIVNHFEKILQEEEEGIVRKESKKSKEQPPPPPAEKPVERAELDFPSLLKQYSESKDRLREGLPNQLFIYFKLRPQYYQKVVPEVQKTQNVEQKKLAVGKIKQHVSKKLSELKERNSWLGHEGVFVDFSGDSQEATFYDRYWYGVIKTTPQKYLEYINTINKSKQFKILQIKTYYALKSKLYLKKGQEKIKKTIADLKAKVQPIPNTQTVTLTINQLPQRFPCSYVYDLVEYAGGKMEDVESVIVQDDYSATITCSKQTALLLINLQGYNHDKGEYIEIDFCEAKKPIHEQGKHKLYYIVVDSEYKMHERELYDTLALQPRREQLSKHASKQQDKLQHFRFAVGSTAALKRVLMFRGDSLNVVKVLPAPAK